jgi:hypothetical protein
MNAASTGPKQRSHVFGYLDETGLLHTPDTDRFFGLGLVIIQNPRLLHRQIIQLKNQQHFYQEFKFNTVQPHNLAIYKRMIDSCFSTPGLRFNCHIVDKTKITSAHPVRSYNGYAGYLIANAIDQTSSSTSEYITILADDVSTNSIDDQFEKMVRTRIQRVTRRNALFGICRVESHAIIELQVCDVLVGAVAFANKMGAGIVSTHGAKAQLVKYIQAKLNVFSLSQQLDLHLRNGIMFCVKQNS